MKSVFRHVFTVFCAVILTAAGLLAQETNYTNGVEDRREKYFAFTNAVIWIDYQTKVEGATLIIRDGKVEAVGKGLAVPKGATEINLAGKHLYPAFIDMYANYGMPEVKRAAGGWGGREQFESDKKGAYAANQAVKAEINAEEVFVVNEAAAADWRKAGFGAVLTHHPDGVVRGTGALLTLHNGRAQEVMVMGRASTHFSLDKGSSTQNYPFSLMGFFALLRQTYLDADWYARTADKKEYNLSLDAFNKTKSLPAIFEARNKLTALRADKIGDEFGVQYIIKGTGDEYQRLPDIKSTGAAFIVPINFPDAYDVSDPLDAELVALSEMKHWELAPTNLAAMVKAGIPVAITLQGLRNKADFWKNIRLAIDNGLSEAEALKALTHTPAQLLRADTRVGSLQKGKLANFIITTGNVFAPETTILDNWIQGNRYIINTQPTVDVRGVYDLTLGSTSGYRLSITGKADGSNLTYSLERASDSLKTSPKVTRSDNFFTISFKNAPKSKESSVGETRLSGWLSGKNMMGQGETPTGERFAWQATFAQAAPDTTKPKPDAPKPAAALGKVIYPFEAYGNEELPRAEVMLFKNATVWTNEKDGILQNADVLVQNGKITQVGKNIAAPAGARTVDATGKHLTAGIIDEHSHIALFTINDVKPNSGMVRMADVVDCDDIEMYRQLAGGVTAAQLLHGSANPIGGQSALIKFKWGESPERLLIPNAPGFIKFALGENPRNANSGNNATTRYPQTRMGVELVYEDAFTRAREYQNRKKAGTLARRDLEMEALVEILEAKRFITCHSYVQSEINMLMKLAERYNFRVNTFTHILEGYKVADKMAKHGVGASSFADWWAYKYEVKDAIPYNMALLTLNGVTTAVNSDDAEMARRLNQEAAKGVKYGGMSEEEAWKMVTLNPAKLLHLDDRMGSIRAGKDADLVLWTDNPLSIYAVVDKTVIDGTVYFDRAQDPSRQTQVAQERARLIQKMLAAKAGGAPAQRPSMRRGRHFHCDTLGEKHEHAEEEE